MMNAEKFLLGNGIRISKRLDQHFLLDNDILEREIELAGLEKGDVVLEIGPGIGNLTKLISERCKVTAIEKDRQFSALLKGYKVIYGDALDLVKTVKFSKVVSNIPYSISQPLLLELLKCKWKKTVLVVQKEFALKMLAKSKLAVFVNDCCDFEIDRFIPGSSFYPPAVDSALVVLEQRKPMDEKFWKFLCRIYTDKNRNVKNVARNCPKELEKKKIHQLGINEFKAIYNQENK